jgi:hypothetical protein
MNRDVLRLSIEGVFRMDERFIAFFSEKLLSSKKNYSMYDLEFYVVVQALKY